MSADKVLVLSLLAALTALESLDNSAFNAVTSADNALISSDETEETTVCTLPTDVLSTAFGADALGAAVCGFVSWGTDLVSDTLLVGAGFTAFSTAAG